MSERTNRKNIPEKILLYGVLLLLLAGGVYALASNVTFSGAERRNLSRMPDSVSLTEWSFDSELETFLSDHVPHRRLLVGVSSTVQALAGQGILLGS
ncbi:MAG: hypothetical protein CW338_00575, partial [Clostridiales bacterium]|nr:hypothetical protein [Clostridiales bacterium]